jgi:hypothetical protein
MLASKQCENKSGLLAYRCSSFLHPSPLPKLALKQANDEQHDNCAKERNNDRGEIKPADSIRHFEERASKPATHQRANNADHDVAKPDPFMNWPANQPAIAPTTIHVNSPILVTSFYLSFSAPIRSGLAMPHHSDGA